MEDWKSVGNVKKLKNGFIHRFDINDQYHVSYSQDVIEAFEKTASIQRDVDECAEIKMKQVNSYMGTGVLAWALEHVGDIAQRMTHHAKYGQVYIELVRKKVNDNLRELSSGYGFDRNHQENLIDSAQLNEIELTEFKAVVEQKLNEYAEAHKKIPVYNKPQWLAREAAIALGEQDFDRSKGCLLILSNLLKNDMDFLKRSTSVMRDKQGNILEYEDDGHVLKYDAGLGY